MKTYIKAANIQMCFRTALYNVVISHALSYRNVSALYHIIQYLPQTLSVVCKLKLSLNTSSYSGHVATVLQYSEGSRFTTR